MGLLLIRSVFRSFFLYQYQFRMVELGRVENPALDFWYHICLAMYTDQNKVDVAINGALVASGVDIGTGMGENMAKELKGNMVVGKWNYTSTGEEEQFVWSITNLAFFTGSPDLAALTADLCNSQGNLLSWDNMRWRVSGEVIELDVSAEEVCRQESSYKLLLTAPMGQRDAVATCDKLGHGNMVVAAEREEINDVVKWVGGETKGAMKCSFLWTPFSDRSEEGTFVNVETGEEQKTIAWKSGQPSGGTTENSLKININLKLIEDEKEANGDCFACKLKRSFSAALRGGCDETKLERLFYLENTGTGGVRYLGWAGSVITYNNKDGVWEVRHHSDPTSVLASVKASSSSFLLGPHQWTFEGDTKR